MRIRTKGLAQPEADQECFAVDDWAVGEMITRAFVPPLPTRLLAACNTLASPAGAQLLRRKSVAKGSPIAAPEVAGTRIRPLAPEQLFGLLCLPSINSPAASINQQWATPARTKGSKNRPGDSNGRNLVAGPSVEGRRIAASPITGGFRIPTRRSSPPAASMRLRSPPTSRL